MEQLREVKISFCILSVAYVVFGLLLLIWPEVSVRTFCYVFGAAATVLGGANLILYFTKDKGKSVLQQEVVIGVIGLAIGINVLLKLEYMLQMIPFALGVVALLGGIIKIQHAMDLKRLDAARWYIMVIWAIILIILGSVLVVNPFDELQKMVVLLIGSVLLIDGTGNLVAILWTGRAFKKAKVIKHTYSKASAAIPEEKQSEVIDAEVVPADQEEKDLPLQRRSEV